jgi:hypothetical protein
MGATISYGPSRVAVARDIKGVYTGWQRHAPLLAKEENSGHERTPVLKKLHPSPEKDFSEKDFASQQFPGFDIKYSASQEKSLHKLISTIALFAFAGTLFAQSPSAGTWKLDTAKQNILSESRPRMSPLVIQEQGDDLRVTVHRD